MAMSEPLMPAHEPPPEPPVTDRDVVLDPDVFVEPEVADADAERAAEHAREHAEGTPFHRPVAGDSLTPERLARDLAAE